MLSSKLKVKHLIDNQAIERKFNFLFFQIIFEPSITQNTGSDSEK